MGFPVLLAVLVGSAGSQRRETLDQGFGVHRLPHAEIALEFNVCVGSRERLWPHCGVDDLAVDHLDDALASP